MTLSGKRCVFVLNCLLVVMMMAFITLRLNNSGVINLRLRNRSVVKLSAGKRTARPSTTKSLPPKIPWRFHIEEDGFFFPRPQNEKKFISYERLHGPITKQIAQFENANVFASLLGRTLLVPKLKAYETSATSSETLNETSSILSITSVKSNEMSLSMFELIDYDLLSTQVKLQELDDDISRLNLRTYEVCHDPRLGFWVDYIPSVENIQTWRVLKQQYFTAVKMNLQTEEKHMCPGTAQYLSRWGPPLTTKPLYRGILSELYARDEDLIFFKGDTLDTSQIRFFNQQRAKKAQELLLFYIRFAHTVTQRIKRITQALGAGFTAILSENIQHTISQFLLNEAKRLDMYNASRSVFIVANNSSRQAFDVLAQQGFTLYFARDFIRSQFSDADDVMLKDDVIHVLSLLACAYAKNFIALPGSADLHFVEHLRLQDTEMLDGLVTNKISVRWAKHTTRVKADSKKRLVKKESLPLIISYAKLNISNIRPANGTTTSPIQSQKNVPKSLVKNVPADKRLTSVKSLKTSRRAVPPKKDKVTSMACSFCSYIKYVSGHDGCPSIKHLC